MVIFGSNALTEGLMQGKGRLGWVSFGPSLFPRHDDGDPLAKAKESGGRQMKRNWFTAREGGIGHLSLRFHVCADSDSSCHSRLELLSMKENCQITVT